jgi:hypothetical protein
MRGRGIGQHTHLDTSRRELSHPFDSWVDEHGLAVEHKTLGMQCRLRFVREHRPATALNTEIGVMIDSPEIAGQVGELMDEGVSPGSAYHVTLDANDNLVWSTENKEGKVEYDTDPETNLFYRFIVGIIGMLPIEDQL